MKPATDAAAARRSAARRLIMLAGCAPRLHDVETAYLLQTERIWAPAIRARCTRGHLAATETESGARLRPEARGCKTELWRVSPSLSTPKKPSQKLASCASVVGH